jgi:glycine/D-amino acid oxidase-like deaminating enzyme
VPDVHDVVVVGAGLAGLRAAQVLCRRGLDVVLLEAADRPGGRVATDVVDGFRCDRGFQVTNTSYPALRAAVDLDALDLRPFEPAAAVRGPDGALHLYADPRRRPALLPRTAFDGLIPLRGKLALGLWTGRVLAAGPRRVTAQAARSAAADLAASGVTGPAVERVLRPFLSGVLGETELATSAAFVRLVWRSFVIGTIAVPAAGMGAIPAQLAAGLPDGVLRLGQRVEAVGPGPRGSAAVRTADAELAARAVVVAADPVTAAALLPRVVAPRMHTLTTLYHVAPTAPARGPTLHLDGTGGPLANTVVLTEAAPAYSPDAPGGDRRALVSSSFVGPAGAVAEPVVRRELARIYAVPTSDWEHLHTVEVTHALPALPGGSPLRRDVALGEGLFVAGDHRDTPSQQGALVSGRRAAEAVLHALRA